MTLPEAGSDPSQPKRPLSKTLLHYGRRSLGPIVGLCITGVLLSWVHTAAVWRAFLQVGWGMLLLLILHEVTVGTDSVGWNALLRRLVVNLRQRDTLWMASVRNAAQTVIPVSASGMIAGLHLLRSYGIQTSKAFASLIAEGIISGAAELFLILTAFACFIGFVPNVATTRELEPLFLIVGILILTLGAMLWVQIDGSVFAMMSRNISRFVPDSRQDWSRGPMALKENLHDLYRFPSTVGFAFFCQVVSLICGAFEIWYILILMHSPVPFVFAILLQTLGRATHSYGFLVPSGWGLQEGVFALLAPLAGLTPTAGLALSLITRLRDVLFALPFLLSWRWGKPRHAAIQGTTI